MKLLFVFGTRPEAIKMAPLILKARESDSFEVKVCVTGQHSEMLYQVLDFFGIRPDHDLGVMAPNQSLPSLTSKILLSLHPVMVAENPSAVLVQGDTTTAFVGALSAYYQKIPIVHIEAGLRSLNKYSPFPEEINRIMVGDLADYHFAPTLMARNHLLREGKDPKSVFVVGNSVIDALFITLELIRKQGMNFSEIFSIDFTKKILLVTGHRRESFGKPFREICHALKNIAEECDVEVVYPVHLNPNVRQPVYEVLGGRKNIHLIEPLSYPQMIWIMEKAYVVLSDSGGIQEEAPSLAKPVLVMRDVTERVEGIEAGTCRLVGTSRDVIIREVRRLIEDRDSYEQMARARNPYGDGNTAGLVLEALRNIFEARSIQAMP